MKSYRPPTPIGERIRDFPVFDPLQEFREEEEDDFEREAPNVAVVDKTQIDSLLRETMGVRESTGKVLEEYYKGYKNYSPRYLQDLATPSNVTGVNSPGTQTPAPRRDLCPMALDYFDE